MTGWWEQLFDTMGAEFSDIGQPEATAVILVRLGVAAVLGGMLGWEREQAGKSAGVRTHMLVAMGAALFVLAAERAGVEPAENSRVLQGIISGIGFLGAGTILKRGDANVVRGLTTAAGIWFTAAVGVAAGLGQESMALLASILGLVVLWALPQALQAANLTVPEPAISLHPPASQMPQGEIACPNNTPPSAVK